MRRTKPMFSPCDICRYAFLDNDICEYCEYAWYSRMYQEGLIIVPDQEDDSCI